MKILTAYMLLGITALRHNYDITTLRHYGIRHYGIITALRHYGIYGLRFLITVITARAVTVIIISTASILQTLKIKKNKQL